MLRLNPATNRNIEAARTRKKAQKLRKQVDEYLRAGNFDRAITDYTKVIRLNPGDATAYNSRDQAYSSQGNYNRATADWERALQSNLNFAEARRNLDAARQQEQQRQQQVSQFRRSPFSTGSDLFRIGTLRFGNRRLYPLYEPFPIRAYNHVNFNLILLSFKYLSFIFFYISHN